MSNNYQSSKETNNHPSHTMVQFTGGVYVNAVRNSTFTKSDNDSRSPFWPEPEMS